MECDENSPGHRPTACQSTNWIFLVVILLILGGPGAPWGGVFAALRQRCAGAGVVPSGVAAPLSLQDAPRCDFIELRYPSPSGGVFATLRLRRGGPESVAAPASLQDDPRCDFIEFRYPAPREGVFATLHLSRPSAIPAPTTTPQTTAHRAGSPSQKPTLCWRRAGSPSQMPTPCW